MDPVTHGLVGAAASLFVSEKMKMRSAAFAGAVSAMMADLDIFIHNPADPLFNIEVHRQFTHSLLFIPAGALVATCILWWLLRKQLSLKELYLFCLMGYATAGLLDACTSYGTQLLWPFLETRFAWNVISVVDPVVTIGLIVFISVAVWKRKKQMVWFAWSWLIFFLMYGGIQHNLASAATDALAEQRGHQIEEMIVKPTIGNQIVWRASYRYNGKIYSDAVRVGLFRGTKIYEGESAPAIIVERDFAPFKETTLYNDLVRFSNLSEGWLIRHPAKPEIIGDARYSMLPTSLVPLWGVETDTTDTEKHLPFFYFRDAGKEIRRPFIKKLSGR